MNSRVRHTSAWPVLRIVLFVILAVATAATAAACDPGHTVTFENQTAQNVTIFRDGRRDFTLKPFEVAGFTFIEFSGQILLEAKNEDGAIILSERLTWSDLERMGWKIAITDSESSGSSPRPYTAQD